MTTAPRKFVPEKGKTLPEIDIATDYVVKNLGFGPIAITITNPERNKMQTMTLGGRKEVVLPGSRMTDYVFELETRGLLRVSKV